MSTTAHEGQAGDENCSLDSELALTVVVLGMSAGGLSALREIVGALPRPFPGALVIAHHVAEHSVLPELIALWTGHACRFATAGEPLRRGMIYVAPPQRHVLINPDGTLGVPTRERVRFVRPSVDWLFESAAAAFGDRAIAVVLSGANDDGARGVRNVARAGGLVMVQSPATCAYPRMPSAAIEAGVAHRCLEPRALGAALAAELAASDNGCHRVWHPFDGESPEPVLAAATSGEPR